MWPLLLSVLAQAPVGDLVLTRQLETTPERAADVVERTFHELQAQGLPLRTPAETRERLASRGLGSAEACTARRACLAKLADGLDSRFLVTVDLGHVGDEMAIGLEALAPSGQVLSSKRFTVKTAGYPAGFDAEATAFAMGLAAALQGDVPLAARSASPVSSTTPRMPQPLTSSQAPTKPRALPWVFGGATVLAVAAAGSLLSLGLASKNQLDRSRFLTAGGLGTTLTEPQAQRLVTTGNAELSASLGCAVGAAVLGAFFVWALLTPGDSP